MLDFPRGWSFGLRLLSLPWLGRIEIQPFENRMRVGTYPLSTLSMTRHVRRPLRLVAELLRCPSRHRAFHSCSPAGPVLNHAYRVTSEAGGRGSVGRATPYGMNPSLASFGRSAGSRTMTSSAQKVAVARYTIWRTLHALSAASSSRTSGRPEPLRSGSLGSRPDRRCRNLHQPAHRRCDIAGSCRSARPSIAGTNGGP